jgi:hypothetical protein
LKQCSNIFQKKADLEKTATFTVPISIMNYFVYSSKIKPLKWPWPIQPEDFMVSQEISKRLRKDASLIEICKVQALSPTPVSTGSGRTMCTSILTSYKCNRFKYINGTIQQVLKQNQRK